jgi:DNA-binding transcriptional regulator LsrR (DeoR family)
VALVGIGAWNQAEPLPPKILAMDADTLARSAGDVAGRLFDTDGEPVHYETEDRLLGIDRRQLLQVRRRIGIAVGIRKTAAIVAAARSGLINVLVTDVVTASALMARLDGHSPVPIGSELPPGSDVS